MKIIKHNLRFIRMEKEISQNKMAELLEINRAQYAAYEEGRCLPKITTLVKISDQFSVSIDEFVRTDLFKKQKDKTHA